jgi:hypothetical protein
MRLEILGLIALLAATAAADTMVVYTMCIGGPCWSWRGIWYTAFGAYTVDGSEAAGTPMCQACGHCAWTGATEEPTL